MPPTIFGVLWVLNEVLPGSILSGEKARKKSVPTRKPELSSSGKISSSVVPGYVVLSKTMSCPACKYVRIFSVADSIKEMSGSRLLLNGVGTPMLQVSTSRHELEYAVGGNRPFCIGPAMVLSDTSPM